MTQIKVEKGVPFPNTVENKYPFLEMEVGDSFAFTDETARRYAKQYDMQFIVSVKFLRCWRKR